VDIRGARGYQPRMESAGTPPARARPGGLRAAVAALGLMLALVGAAAWALVGIVLHPAPAVPVEPTAVAPRALSEHVILLIADGLRYDVATDGRMPHFAAAMERHSSGAIWAGTITMSSAAILAYGTGQRGGIEQLVFNMDPRPPSLNTWLANAARDHELGAVGDLTWVKLYGADLAYAYPDPPGVAMEADLNPASFANVRALIAKAPSFIAAQFTTPDHQGHVYGIPSDAYAAHMRHFDQLLDELQRELGPEWTVIVTSDHGAQDSGSHGTDTDVERRSPIFVYGPGIRPGIRIDRRLEQPELANTLPVLLGVAPPAHSFGHTIVEWLDYSASEVSQVACNEARRAARYGAAAGNAAFGARADAICARGDDPAGAVDASRALVADVGAKVHSGGLGSAALAWWMLAACVATIAIAAVAFARGMLPSLPFAVGLGVVALALTFYVEKLPSGWQKPVLVTLFVLANLLAVAAVFFPGRLNDWLDARGGLAPVVLPGLLVASYTTNTQAMSFVAIASCTLYFVLSGPAARGAHLFRTARLALPRAGAAAALVCVAILFFPGTRKQDHWGSWVLTAVTPMLAVSCAGVVAWIAARAWRGGAPERVAALAGAPVMIATLLARRLATPWLGRLLIALLLVSALVFAWQKRRSLALYFGLAAYALLLTREIQIVAVIASLGLAELVAASLPRELARHTLLLLAIFVFGLFFVQRIAIQGGVDIDDFAPAATFGDTSPPWWVVSVAVTLRWLVPEVLTLGLLLWPAGLALRDALLRGLTVVYAARVTVLVLMIGICGNSFWTAKRCLGDIPFAALAAVAVATLWLVHELVTRRGGDRAPASLLPFAPG
jgi:hypothetical protein